MVPSTFILYNDDVNTMLYVDKMFNLDTFIMDRVLGMRSVHPPTTCLNHGRDSKFLPK